MRGIRHLLLAHQAEDQAETILMRLAKGSGIDGLAGMSAHSMSEDIHIWRPFLAIPKARLIATCDVVGLPYVVDASNASERFARGRLRKVMPLLAEEGLSLERLCDLGARAQDARAALDHYARLLLRVGTVRDEAGALRFDREHLRNAPRAVGLRALALCLQEIHAEDYPPEHAALMRLWESLVVDEDMPARTLHGCLIAAHGRHASILREYAGITDKSELAAGASVLWDRRWQVSLIADAGDTVFTVKPLGHPPHAALDQMAPGLRHRIPQGRARAALPALCLERLGADSGVGSGTGHRHGQAINRMAALGLLPLREKKRKPALTQ